MKFSELIGQFNLIMITYTLLDPFCPNIAEIK